MADITFGDLIALIFRELSATFEQTADQAELLKLHVENVNLDMPTHVRLQVEPEAANETRRLMLTMPSTRETPPVGRLGRIRITIAGPHTRAAEETP